ncbi:hypothetical protein M8C21_026747 [Ambrosia artemisiifolia]|uniref:Uncharacterized protein n=1 Tax=Ambrosia artemisiifolia TaxID=4212 RepID=A0AAD5GEN1_AMBAR|nr:hypothetical protein M8C21_026747 [Ambrosia artemisiifolia]
MKKRVYDYEGFSSLYKQKCLMEEPVATKEGYPSRILRDVCWDYPLRYAVSLLKLDNGATIEARFKDFCKVKLSMDENDLEEAMRLFIQSKHLFWTNAFTLGSGTVMRLIEPGQELRTCKDHDFGRRSESAHLRGDSKGSARGGDGSGRKDNIESQLASNAQLAHQGYFVNSQVWISRFFPSPSLLRLHFSIL